MENNKFFGIKGKMHRKAYLVNNLLFILMFLVQALAILGLVVVLPNPLAVVGLVLLLAIFNVITLAAMMTRRIASIVSEESSVLPFTVGTIFALLIPYVGALIKILLFVLPANTFGSKSHE